MALGCNFFLCCDPTNIFLQMLWLVSFSDGELYLLSTGADIICETKGVHILVLIVCKGLN